MVLLKKKIHSLPCPNGAESEYSQYFVQLNSRSTVGEAFDRGIYYYYEQLLLDGLELNSVDLHLFVLKYTSVLPLHGLHFHMHSTNPYTQVTE